MALMWIGWKIIKRTRWVRLSEMDLETDRYVPEEERKVNDGRWKGRARETLRWLF